MENEMFMEEYEKFVQTETDGESSAVYLNSAEEDQLINHATLGGVLKILKLDNLLSELDNDLELIATGKQSVNDHKEYFKTQINRKLKKASIDYHPDIVKNKGGSEEEISQATEMQQKLNSVRMILRHFNEKFSECVGFKYSFFAQIEINVLSDEKRLEQLSYGVLTKLGKLARIKNKKLIPNLNEFLRSSHASIKGFSENNLRDFLQGKGNALRYFNKYLSSHKESVNELKLLKESFKEDDQLSSISSIINEMLKKGMVQFGILNQLSKLFHSDGLELILIKFNLFRDLDSNQDYEQADKYFTLPLMAYINILFLCNEIYLREQSEAQKERSNVSQFGNALLSYAPNVVSNVFKKGRAIYKIAPIDEEIARKVEVLQAEDLYKISRYLVAYYCHDNEKGGKLAAELLGVDEVSKDLARALLIKVIGIYANYLAEKFKPGKSVDERVIELLTEQEKIIKNAIDRLIEIKRGFNNELLKISEEMKEANAVLIPKMEETIKANQELSKKNEESIRESQEARKKNEELSKKVEASQLEMQKSIRESQELARRNQELSKKVEASQSKMDESIKESQEARRAMQEVTAQLTAMLGSAGRPQKVNGVHKPNCSKVTDAPISPSTDMNGELTLNHCVRNQKGLHM